MKHLQGALLGNKILCWAALLFVEFFLQTCSFIFYVADSCLLLLVLKWGALVLAVLALTCLICRAEEHSKSGGLLRF